MFLINFGVYSVQSGLKDVTKGVKTSRFWNSCITIGFLVPKNVPIPIFRSNQTFHCFFIVFWSILGHLGYNRSSVTSQMGSEFYNFEILTLLSAFSSQKTYPCQVLDQNNHLIVIYCVFGQFWAFLGTIGAQWRHKGGQDFKILK